MQIALKNAIKHQTENQQQASPFLVVSTQEIRNIAEQMTQPIHANQEQFIESLNNKIKDKQGQIQLLECQNTKLKSSNKQLIKQLQIFSRKLDEELKKRAESQDRKPPKITLKPEEKESIQIQNLYKKIQIYKKEVAMLKTKLYEENDGGNKLNDFENKAKTYMKDNDGLREEIKSLKRIIKLQEKGLSDIGADGFVKITGQNQKLKEEVKKLRLQMDQVQRKYRTSHLEVTRPKHKTPLNICSQLSEPYFPRSSYPTSHKHLLLNRKKNYSDYRTKTEPQTIVHKESRTQQNESELNQIKVYVQKIEKLEGKIRVMNCEKIRQREIIENLKVQILQKDKEVNYLREKTEGLRKIVKGRKQKVGNNQSKQNLNESEHSYLDAIEQIPSRSQSKFDNPSQNQTIPIEESINNKSRKSQQRQLPSQQPGKSKHRYPRLQQIGSRKQSSYKWNHQQFSSKIKQVQVYLTSTGVIQYIHARYQKGEPNKSSELINKKFTALVCSQNGEYIQQIRGGFRDSYLQYLVIRTSHQRVVQFGKCSNQDQCKNFLFNFSEGEYPCALLGENDSEGVLRFGCFVEKS